MSGENLTNADGMLKDSYAAKKSVTKQPSGFQKLAPFHKRIRGINFSKFVGGLPKSSGKGGYNG